MIRYTSSRFALSITVACAAAATGCATPDTQVFGRLSSDTLRLFNGDSVELQGKQPAVVQGRAPGLILFYYPFRDLSDSARLRKIALGVFMHVWPEIETSPPPFVVLRAVNLPRSQRTGVYNIVNYGFVIERRPDGHWYFLGETDPVH